MGRVAKKAQEAPKAVEESPAQTITQTRARRTPKPNPKYANDSVILPPKIESSESNGSTDIEDKLPETKIVKSTKKVVTNKTEESAAKARSVQKVKTAATAVALKKQKIEFDDDEKTKDADEVPLNTSPTPPPTVTRTTRSLNKSDTVKDEKGEIKVGEESVAIIDVSSIIAKGPSVKQESPKAVTRGGPGRKRQAQEVETKEESPKKKKEEDKPSMITTRKSYIAGTKKDEEEKMEVEKPPEEDQTEKKDVETEVKTPVSTIKTRRNATTPQSAEPVEKKTKVDEIKSTENVAVKSTNSIVEPKKLPVLRKEQITKVSPVVASLNPKPAVTNVVADNVTTQISKEPKPAPRLLNSMITPKGAKMSPNVKLAGDGSDKKVFSIDMSDESLIEKKQQQQQPQKTIVATVTSPVKSSPAIKENVAIVTKPQPSVLLKNKLESELNRMKASANLIKRQMLTTPQVRQSAAAHSNAMTQSGGARRITKFESWYVIDVKNSDPIIPNKNHPHTYSLIRIGNKIKDIQLPSSKWEYKITLQRRQQMKQQNNNNEEDLDEFYTGDVHDKTIEAEKHNYEPNCILFKRSFRDNNKISIDRSVMIKQNVYNVTMNGKSCQLVGAPDDIKSIEDIEILLKIVDTSSLTHSMIEILQ